MADPVSVILTSATLAVQIAGTGYPVYVNTDSLRTIIDKTDSSLAIISKGIVDLKKENSLSPAELKPLTLKLNQ
jgi:hypothetical protein